MMTMDDQLAGLVFSTEEDQELVVESNQVVPTIFHYDLCLIGPFFTDRPINFAAMKNKLASLWRPGRGISIQALDSNLFLFQFYHKIDFYRVLDGFHFTFNSHLLLVHWLKSGDIPVQISLFFFWLIFGLSFMIYLLGLCLLVSIDNWVTLLVCSLL